MNQKYRGGVALAGAVIVAAFAHTSNASADEGEGSCSTFYNDHVYYANEPEPRGKHTSWKGPHMYDPNVIEGYENDGEFEVTGSPHNDWQTGFVPKTNHSPCGGGSGHH
jgi:hypothetical protein